MSLYFIFVLGCTLRQENLVNYYYLTVVLGLHRNYFGDLENILNSRLQNYLLQEMGTSMMSAEVIL
jgi:hypothetical protein